jgi:hypothetical protein
LIEDIERGDRQVDIPSQRLEVLGAQAVPEIRSTVLPSPHLDRPHIASALLSLKLWFQSVSRLPSMIIGRLRPSTEKSTAGDHLE